MGETLCHRPDKIVIVTSTDYETVLSAVRHRVKPGEAGEDSYRLDGAFRELSGLSGHVGLRVRVDESDPREVAPSEHERQGD